MRFTTECTILDVTFKGAVESVEWTSSQSDEGRADVLTDKVLASIRRGVADADAGRVTTWDEARSA